MALDTPTFLQTKKYPAKELRSALLDVGVQAGVLGATDLKVTQRGAGANMTVDVATGAAWVKGSFTARQGLYHAFNAATINAAVASNASGNPRVDQVILRIHDSVDGGSSQDAAALEVLTGTPAAGAQIDTNGGANYRAGAAGLPATAFLLADILVPNGAGSILDSNIIDRRLWARGASKRVARAAGSADITAVTTSYVQVDSALATRVEIGSSGRLKVRLSGEVFCNASAEMRLAPFIDGALAPNKASWSGDPSGYSATANTSVGWEAEVPVAAGSHSVDLRWRSSAGTMSLLTSGTNQPDFEMVVDEIIRPSAGN